MYDFATWSFVDKQKKQKFDSISDGHEAALIAMGVLQSAAKKEESGPKCPDIFIDTMDKYRALKFLQRHTSDSIRLYPRDMLTWRDLLDYQKATGHHISMLEAELIMGIDAIFEGREDG